MSKKNLIDAEIDSNEEEEDDDDYCPIKNENDHQSDASDDSEHDDNDNPENQSIEEKQQIDLNIKPYDESKANELWKTFTTTTSNSKPSTITDNPKPTNKIFDYAGEKVSVPVPVPTTSSLKRPAPAVASANSVLDRLGIGKKPKLSTLEKSRLDWSAHKESESLNDDLDSHRRSKDSYVEKKAFLQRSDLREHDHYLTNIKKK